VEGVVGHGSRGKFVKCRPANCNGNSAVDHSESTTATTVRKLHDVVLGKAAESIFRLKRDEPVVHVKEIHPREMAELLSQLAQHEQKDLMELYQTFRFAFPKCSSILFEDVFTRQREILISAVAQHETYIIRHPCPVCFADLYKRISPLLASSTKGAEVAPFF